MTRDQILDCLNRERTRATYGAVGDVIGIPAQSVGRALGRRTQRASWVVNARTGEPTGYNDQQKHPDLRPTSPIITTGDELRRLCAKCHGRSATAQADRQRSRSPTGIASPVFFISADWSKDAGKRSVHVADMSARCIGRPQDRAWTLKTLLKLAAELAQRGSVLVGIDAALGIPADYWSAVQAQYGKSGDRPPNFVDWLCRIDPHSEFFVEVHEPRQWRADRPFFSVPGRKGGLNDFKNRFSDGFLRPIDKLTGAKPLFAVSGIPGTVGSGTRALWKELIPLLADKREFAVWPFEGGLPELLPRHGIVLAETYPGLAYAVALAPTLPAARWRVAKTQLHARKHACQLLMASPWVQVSGVELGDLEPARNDEDAFDSHLTAAAVLRCGLEGRALCDDEWIDNRAGGAMLLAGPVDPSRPARSLPDHLDVDADV